MYQVVVSTGGGAVIRPINWSVIFIPSQVKHMKLRFLIDSFGNLMILSGNI